jgi:hypothetical protein
MELLSILNGTTTFVKLLYRLSGVGKLVGGRCKKQLSNPAKF